MTTAAPVVPDILKSFPWKQYPEILDNQRTALTFIAEHDGSALLELPTGSGKTAVGFTFLRWLAKQEKGPLFYIAPTKALVEQVKDLHPEVEIALGRTNYPCLYYGEEKSEELTANDIPCSLLEDCPHRVDQKTGKTHEDGAMPCPYLQAKYQAKQAKIVACTTSFYLFTQMFSQEWERPAGLVIDEAHRLAGILRSALSFEITDWHLKNAIKLLKSAKLREEARQILDFLVTMRRVIRKKPFYTPTLLEEGEIRALLNKLGVIDADELRKKLGAAIKKREIDPVAERETLRRLEIITRDLTRYIRAFEYSLPAGERQPLNYTYAYYTKERPEGKRVQYRLVVKAYYVSPVVKRILGRRTVAYSATIGDKEVFRFETGIKAPFLQMGSDFPAEHTRIFVPTDTPNLAQAKRKHGEPARVLRRIVTACGKFARAGHRSLVVVTSNAERDKFKEIAAEEDLKIVSYGNGVLAKDAVMLFKDGEGDALVGTTANFGEGIDLPRSLAPVIFFLRPSYPPPNDPLTVFEKRRFGTGRVWALWRWRVMIEALQVRGRNIRSAEDLGVTFFISQQFRDFLRASLPKWLENAYRGNLTFDQCVREAKELLSRQ